MRLNEDYFGKSILTNEGAKDKDADKVTSPKEDMVFPGQSLEDNFLL